MCEECTCGEHAKHATVPLKDVLEQHKASLQEQLDAVKNRCFLFTNVLSYNLVLYLTNKIGLVIMLY